MGARVTITALDGLPRVRPGDNLAALLIEALAPHKPARHDILVVAQKIVSKAEGRYVELNKVRPSSRAEELARTAHKDPRIMEILLAESDEVLRAKAHVVIAAHHLGLVIANGGIDQSNLEDGDDGKRVLLLPVDPDASAARLKEKLDVHFGVDLGVIVSDSAGRAWRNGTVGLAIGAAGIPSLIDWRGTPDLAKRKLEVTETGFADSVASAAVLVMGEAAEGTPAALVRGLDWTAAARPARALVRARAEDLFR